MGTEARQPNPIAVAMSDLGLHAYPELQRQLSRKISADEAESARILFKESEQAIWVGAAVLAAAAVLDGQFSSFGSARSLMCDVAPLLVSLALISRWRVPWAGRIILPMAALFLPSSDDFGIAVVIQAAFFGRLPDPVAGQLFGYLDLAIRLIAGLALGWVVDTGATSGFGGIRRPLWALMLSVVSLLLIGLGIFLHSEWWSFTDWWASANPYRAALVLVWVWFAHERLVRAERYGRSDVAIVFRAALSRWGRRFVGRGLAIASLSVTAVATLNGFALPDALSPGGIDRAVRANVVPGRGGDAQVMMFFWPRQGRLLRHSDFSVDGRYFYAADSMPPELSKRYDNWDRIVPAIGFDAFNARRFEEQQRELRPWRVDSAEAFILAIEQRADLSLKEHRLWVLDRHPAHNPISIDSSISDADARTTHIREPLHLTLKPMTEGFIARFESVLLLNIVGAAVFSCFAFVVLWRRGGDLIAARWIGLWIAGLAMFYANPIVEFVYDSTIVTAAQSTGIHWVSHSLKYVIGLIRGWMYLIAVLSMTGMLAWAAYLHLRQPALRNGAGVARTRQRLAAVCDSKITALVASALVVILSSKYSQSTTTFAFVAGAATLCGICSLEALRRRYNVVADGDRRLHFTIPAVAFLITAQSLFVLCAFIRSEQAASWAAEWSWLVILALMLYAILATAFLLRSDWLRLSAGRDLSWLLSAFALPFLFEIVNGLWLPALFGRLGIFLPGATNVASLVVVVALMQPIQRVLESIFAVVTAPMLRRIRGEVDRILENSFSNPSSSDLSTQVEALFKRLGVDGYALWSRRGLCEFLPEINRLKVIGEPLKISSGLCRDLAEWHSVVDLDSVHSEWRFFFYQFELHRLAVQTGARYIYPVRFGRSLWGLLALRDSPATRGLARDAFGATASQIGIMLTTLRR